MFEGIWIWIFQDTLPLQHLQFQQVTHHSQRRTHHNQPDHTHRNQPDHTQDTHLLQPILPLQDILHLLHTLHQDLQLIHLQGLLHTHLTKLSSTFRVFSPGVAWPKNTIRIFSPCMCNSLIGAMVLYIGLCRHWVNSTLDTYMPLDFIKIAMGRF